MRDTGHAQSRRIASCSARIALRAAHPLRPSRSMAPGFEVNVMLLCSTIGLVKHSLESPSAMSPVPTDRLSVGAWLRDTDRLWHRIIGDHDGLYD
jgi:hypothetical protein